MKYLIVILVLSGCSKELKLPKQVSIDPTLLPYVIQFQSDAIIYGHPVTIDNLIVEFRTDADDIPGSLGSCSPDGTPNIHINPIKWPGLSAIERIWLMYHELGHCVLFLEHDQAMVNVMGYSIAKSIMYPYEQAPNIYVDHWDYYLNELFKGE